MRSAGIAAEYNFGHLTPVLFLTIKPICGLHFRCRLIYVLMLFFNALVSL